MTTSLDFYARYPKHMLALRVLDRSDQPGGLQRLDRVQHTREMDDVESLLRAGQDEGEFRAFDVAVMAGTVRAVLDQGLVLVSSGHDAGSDFDFSKAV